MSSASIAEFKSNSINYKEEIAVRYMLIVDALPVASGFLISPTRPLVRVGLFSLQCWEQSDTLTKQFKVALRRNWMLIVDSRHFSNVYPKVGNPKVSNEDRIYTPKSSLTNIFFLS